jgi:hypothetical protein
MLVRATENRKRGLDAQLAAAERAVASAQTAEAKEQAEDAKAKAAAKDTEIEEQLAGAKAELQPKLDAAAAAREAATAAEAARAAAAQAVREAAQDLEPVSVFISRKTQRLYVRQGFQPVWESPVTIEDPDRPIGTHVFTAMERGGDDLRWSVVSLPGGHRDGEAPARGSRSRNVEPSVTDLVAAKDLIAAKDLGSAKEALDRITIPPDTLDRIATMASPRSSLIISDEALSAETGKGTEFVVIMSGEPQGGIKFRRHGTETVRYDRPGNRLSPWSSPFATPFFRW